MQFQISSRRKTGKEIPEPSRLEFLEKFSANILGLSDAEGNTYGPLNNRFRRTYSRFTFVLLAYASLAASRMHFFSIKIIYTCLLTTFTI